MRAPNNPGIESYEHLSCAEAREALAGLTAPKLTYRPGGYPEFGLVARTLPMRYRPGVSLTNLQTKLERWERKHGNPSFRAIRLHRLPAPLAFELAHVYVALRERYPEIRPDYVDFRSVIKGGALGEAYGYSEFFPAMRRLARDGYAPEDTDELAEMASALLDGDLADLADTAKAEVEVMAKGKVIDPLASGAIHLADVFSKPRSYRALLLRWTRRNLGAASQGWSARIAPFSVSPAAFVLIHEFGHLVESELLCRREADVRRVYGSLSRCLFGGRTPRANQWRYHLWNYPTYPGSPQPGRHTGNAERQRQTRKALTPDIRAKFGMYATSCRDELFAEAFGYAHTAPTSAERASLRPFLDELAKIGMRKKRVQPAR